MEAETGTARRCPPDHDLGVWDESLSTPNNRAAEAHIARCPGTDDSEDVTPEPTRVEAVKP